MAPPLYENGILYGTTYSGGGSSRGREGTVFALNLKTGVATVLHVFHDKTGYFLDDGLVSRAGRLFGTPYSGTEGNAGSVFSVNPSTGATNTLVEFTGPNGANPNAALIFHDGVFYGTAFAGGASSLGAVFKLVP